MRSIILFLLVGIVNISSAQWTKHHGVSIEPNICTPILNNGTDARELYMVNDSSGFILGNDFTTPSLQWKILQSVCDYGYNPSGFYCSTRSWQHSTNVASPSNFHFLSMDTLFFLKTSQWSSSLNSSNNGGLTDFVLHTSTDDVFWDTFFLRSDTGIVSSTDNISNNGYLLSYKGGIFDTLFTSSTKRFPSIEVVKDSIIFGLSFAGLNFEFESSIDRGQTWNTLLSLPQSSYNLRIQQLKFVTDSIGFLVLTNDTVYETLDQGNTWSALPLDYNRFQGIFEFITPNLWYAVQTPDSLFKTYDHGANWVNDGLGIDPINAVIKDIEIRGDSLGYVIANTCKLYTKTQGVHIGVGELNDGHSLTIYPNPTTEQLYISGDFTNAQLLDVTGKQIKSYANLTNTINVADLPQGVYFLKLETEHGSVVKKFIKQ